MADPGTGHHVSHCLQWAKAALWRFALIMVAANIAIPAAMLAVSILTGEAYWRMYRGEDHAANWFSSLQLLVLAMLAHGNYRLAGVATRLGGGHAARSPFAWWLFALGFTLLALDERFNIHEALRDRIFRPSGFFTEVDWLIPGDVGLYLFLLAGVLCAFFLRDDLQRAPHAARLFLAALVLGLATFVIDSLRDSAMAGWPLRRFLDYTFEEVGELWAQLLFALCFIRVLTWRLRSLENGLERRE